jgi:hypothetical protein
VAHRKASRPATVSVNGPRVVSQAGMPRDRDATSNKTAKQGDRLVATMRANLERATEPALVVKLREAIDRIQASRRGAP